MPGPPDSALYKLQSKVLFGEALLEDDDDDYFIPGYRNRVSHRSRRRASDSYNTEVD